jgi:hypothetical protein
VQLNELFSFEPEKEISKMNGCHRTCDSIWDRLGYYQSKSSLVTICEKEISDYVQQLHPKQIHPVFGKNKKQIRQILRDSVRLHEHVHALLHRCNFENLEKLIKLPMASDLIYENLPKSINEPLCMIICYSVIKKMNLISYDRLFSAVDKTMPRLYQRWHEIKDVIDTLFKGKPMRDYIHFVPSLVKISRKKVFSNFDDYIKEIKASQNEMRKEYTLLEARLKLI